jgi:hypothetical protein
LTCLEQNTHGLSENSSWVTITHSANPRYGEKAEVIRVCKGSDPDLIVRFPDGRHSPIFASFT